VADDAAVVAAADKATLVLTNLRRESLWVFFMDDSNRVLGAAGAP
jgi:hypothetical protein